MSSSANEIIRAAIFSAVIDAVKAFRDASNGVPNAMLRDLSAVHANTGFGDLPEEVQKAIRASTEETFRRLLKDGYVIQPKSTPRPTRKG